MKKTMTVTVFNIAQAMHFPSITATSIMHTTFLAMTKKVTIFQLFFSLSIPLSKLIPDTKYQHLLIY
jgi:hypothetical protein